MFWASLSVCLSVRPSVRPSVRLSVPLMGTTFRYIFLEEERCWPANTYTMLKPIVQTVIIRVQFFRAAEIFVGNGV